MRKELANAKKFQPWAPKLLSDWHQCLGIQVEPKNGIAIPSILCTRKWEITWGMHLPNSEMQDLLLRWGSHEDMRNARETISKKVSDDREVSLGAVALYLCHNCISHLAFFKSQKRRTKKQRTKHLADIENKAKELVALMQDCVEFLDSTLSDWIDDRHVENLVQSIANVSFGLETEFTAAAKREACNQEHSRNAISYCLPNMTTLLAALSQRAGAESARDTTNTHTIGLAAEINYFHRSLSCIMLNQFGEPMDDVVTAFTQAAYPQQTIAADQVKKARQRAGKQKKASTKRKTNSPKGTKMG